MGSDVISLYIFRRSVTSKERYYVIKSERKERQLLINPMLFAQCTPFPETWEKKNVKSLSKIYYAIEVLIGFFYE